MYINAVGNSVILYLQHDFDDIIFKIKNKLYIASGSAPLPPLKNSGRTPATDKAFVVRKVNYVPWLHVT
jgi:hypothetical protein